MKSIVCSCSEIILKSASDVSKIRSRIMLVRGGNVYAVCKSCSAEVKVPLVLAPQDPGPALIIKR